MSLDKDNLKIEEVLLILNGPITRETIDPMKEAIRRAGDLSDERVIPPLLHLLENEYL